MSHRPQFSPFAVVSAGDMSGDITSSATIIQKLSMVSYQCSWAGAAPVGTLEVQTSNDYSLYADGSINNPGIWSTIPFTNFDGTTSSTVLQVPVTGNAGNGVFDIDAIGLYALRVVYTATSGTGTLKIVICAKVS